MDEKELKKWLEDKPNEVALAIASRAALRVAVNLPWKSWASDHEQSKQLTLACLRGLLISSICIKKGNSDLINVARSAIANPAFSYSMENSAGKASRSATRSTLSSAKFFAVEAALYSSQSTRAYSIWPEVGWDTGYIQPTFYQWNYNYAPSEDMTPTGRAKDILDQKLFNVEANDWSAKDFGRLQRAKKEHPEFAWWVDWLVAIHNSKFNEWDLAYRIATEIPEEAWKQGAITVARYIESIQIDMVNLRNAPLGEQLEPKAFSESEIRRSLEGQNLRPKALNANAMQCLQRVQADLRTLEDQIEPDVYAQTTNDLKEISALLVALDQYLPDGEGAEDTQYETIGNKLHEIALKLMQIASDEKFLREGVTIGLVGIILTVVCTLAPAASYPLSVYLGGKALSGNFQISIGKNIRARLKGKSE